MELFFLDLLVWLRYGDDLICFNFLEFGTWKWDGLFFGTGVLELGNGMGNGIMDMIWRWNGIPDTHMAFNDTKCVMDMTE